MSKGTTIKEALAKWEETSKEQSGKAKVVKLYMQLPPIEKMDASLSALVECEHLALSTNNIEKISNLQGLGKLKTLSLARNNLKTIGGLEPVAGTLEELWLSYNSIDRLKGIEKAKNLKVLYMSHNRIKDVTEIDKLNELEHLEELILLGNPIEERLSAEEMWETEVAKRLPRLKKLDGKPIVRDD